MNSIFKAKPQRNRYEMSKLKNRVGAGRAVFAVGLGSFGYLTGILV